MFNNLSTKLVNAFKNFSGQRLTEDNIKDALNDIKVALLEGDVSLPVVKQLLAEIGQKAIGQNVLKSLRPTEMFIKIVHDELVKIMEDENPDLNFKTQSPAVILMVGLQGSGKTTTVAKLAKFIKEHEHKSVLITSTDIYRPAALEQLGVLAKQIEIDYYHDPAVTNPVEIAKNALQVARKNLSDVVIVDTAGRLHIDNEMMTEISKIHAVVNPIETLFVIDSMVGQDAVNSAKEFANTLSLTGVILTKVDGDARGGAALSVKMVTDKPIKFMGVGEKLDAFEKFHPERIVSRILGMGDVMTLVEEAEQKIDQEKSKKLAQKIVKGRFDFEDLLDQLRQLRKLGGMSNFLSKLPMMGGMTAKLDNMVSEQALKQTEAIISSMTIKERRFPAVINGSRKRRIAEGSGTTILDVNRLLKQLSKMEKMMKHLKGGKMMNLLKNFTGKFEGA